jgi:hypothetical protein
MVVRRTSPGFLLVVLFRMTLSGAAEFTDSLITVATGAFHICAQKQPHAGRRSQSGEFSEAIPRANRLRRNSEDPRDVTDREYLVHDLAPVRLEFVVIRPTGSFTRSLQWETQRK